MQILLGIGYVCKGKMLVYEKVNPLWRPVYIIKGVPKKTATFVIKLDLYGDQVKKRDLIRVFGHQ